MPQSATWVLLLYSLPSEPSRLRVRIWRDLRRAGAVIPRDGVCALPDTARARAWAERTRALVVELGGSATVAEQARLDSASATALIAQISAVRAEEFAEIGAAAEGLRAHLAELINHFRPDPSALAELYADLRRLRTWLAQARERDDLGLGDAGLAERGLAACADALSRLSQAESELPALERPA